MNKNQVNQISIDNWTFKLFYKVNILINAFMLMKFITASFSYSHLHNHNKTNIISILIILEGNDNDPARVQPALWHQAVLWRTDQLRRGGNTDDWQKYAAAAFLSTFIRL